MKKILREFVIIWIGMSLALCFGILVQDTFLGRVVGASPAEIAESYDLVSLPLEYINPWFVVRSGTSTPQLIVILIANSYFDSLLLFPVVKFVRHRLRRSNPIQLGISSPSESADREEERQRE
jgi:hypothetical protein